MWAPDKTNGFHGSSSETGKYKEKNYAKKSDCGKDKTPKKDFKNEHKRPSFASNEESTKAWRNFMKLLDIL